MSFADFRDRIEAPELRAIADHWRTACGHRLMPGWSDIDPTKIGRNLRYVWAWKYDRASESFTGRLAGEEIDRAFGKSLRGIAMTDFFSPDAYRLVFPRHRRVVTEPALMHGTGMVFLHVDRTLVGERIIMPLAADGANGDGIIGATFYRTTLATDAGDVRGADFSGERVEFFAIEESVPSHAAPITSTSA